MRLIAINRLTALITIQGYCMLIQVAITWNHSKAVFDTISLQ